MYLILWLKLKMDRAWMYDAPRHGEIYIKGLSVFIEIAEKDALTKKTKEIYCPEFVGQIKYNQITLDLEWFC